MTPRCGEKEVEEIKRRISKRKKWRMLILKTYSWSLFLNKENEHNISKIKNLPKVKKIIQF